MSAQPQADFTSHRIEGYARAAMEQGKNGAFDVPLLSHIEGNLWMGGCIGGVRLPDDFEFVVSLYPWEQYKVGDDTSVLEIEMYDSGDEPDAKAVRSLARMVNAFRAKGKTLVHCQAGLNRSGLITATALVLDGWDPEVAIGKLREKRCPVVLCNATFERWVQGLA